MPSRASAVRLCWQNGLMCSNYRAVTNIDLLVSFFGITRDPNAPPPEFNSEVWPLGLAPIVRLDANGRRAVEAGNFGLVPHWGKELAFGRRTYNARTETVSSKPSFRDAWKRSQRCIVPAAAVYEPCYESGKAVRWAIEHEAGEPMGVAGIWVDHPTLKRENGDPVLSFAMLTVNADGHPVFQRMHAPEDEKRMVVILDPSDFDVWLTCSPDEATEFFKQWMKPLKAYAKPLAPRKRKVKEEGSVEPKAPPPDELFPPLVE